MVSFDMRGLTRLRSLFTKDGAVSYEATQHLGSWLNVSSVKVSWF